MKEYNGFVSGYLTYSLNRLKERGWKYSHSTKGGYDVWIARTSEIRIHADGTLKFIGNSSTWYNLLKDPELNIMESIYGYDV